MPKKTSPVKFIMDLLDISIPQVAQCLCIDRTTISKWRSGSRRLSERSPYFDKLAYFFTEKNKLLGSKPLTDLFADLFPDMICESQSDITELIKKYMKQEISSQHIRQFANEMQNALYHSQVSVFRGADGRKSALNIVLGMAEISPTPCRIKIFELDGFEWLDDDMDYTDSLISRFDLLTQRGHIIELTHAPCGENDKYPSLLHSLSTLFSNDKVSIHLINPCEYINILPCIYGIEGKCVAIGINYEYDMQKIHTIIHSDTFTISKYLMLHDQMTAVYAHPFPTETERA